MFRIRDVINYLKCPKRFYLAKQSDTRPFEFINFPYSYDTLAQEFLGAIEDCAIGHTGMSTKESLDLLDNHTWLMNGRFEANNLRHKVKFLKRVDVDGLDVSLEEMLGNPDAIENVHGSIYDDPGLDIDWVDVDCYALSRVNFPKEQEAKRLAKEVWLLKECGVRVRNFYVVHLNGNYRREGELDVASLFRMETRLYKEGNKQGKSISELVLKHYRDLSPTLIAMEEVMEQGGIEVGFHLECTKHRKCESYETCFLEENLPDDSIIFLSQTRKKYQMLAEGITTIGDIDLDAYALSYLQYAQYQSAITKQVFVDQVALSQWMKKLEFPISYLDFEWDTYGIPLYDRMKPYDVLCFQFSLHVDFYGKLTKVDFLDSGDCRVAFIEALLAAVPASGSIVAYHAEGAEKLRLQELAVQFPQYAYPLLRLCERMVDLTYPFMNGVVYHPKMRGTYSLKKLLSIIQPDHDYQELSINHGLKAVAAHRELLLLPQAEQATIVESLKEYCSLDTYAMVVVVAYLRSLITAL